jgi:hypothetical protein
LQKKGRRRKVQTTRGLDNYLNVSGPDAEFVSDGGQEYKLEVNEIGQWFVKRYKGGPVAKPIQGFWMTRNEAKDALIRYLRRTDRLNRAWWPGKPNPRMDLPYGPSQC